jgi:hypothetical protein
VPIEELGISSPTYFSAVVPLEGLIKTIVYVRVAGQVHLERWLNYEPMNV